MYKRIRESKLVICYIKHKNNKLRHADARVEIGRRAKTTGLRILPEREDQLAGVR